jgi:rhodanese-related sulfurtransferase
MYRRNKERRYRRKRRDDYDRPGRGFTSAFRRPTSQIALLAVVALVIFLILQMGRGGSNAPVSLPRQITVSEAFTKYQNGAFVLDVRTQEEWDDFHAPNTMLIPLDQLPVRLNELPRGEEIVIVCRTGNRSQQARDILLNAGFEQVSSMMGGLTEWRASGYPTEP